MSTQALSEQGLAAWVAFIRGHATLIRSLNAQLVSDHGLTINDYEVLLRLSRAPERRLKRVELAQSVLLTPSGITRLLDGLEASGWVEKAACESDARVTYAVLTEQGLAKLHVAAESHLEDVDRVFAAHFETEELEALASLLSRLGAGEVDECRPG
jgi:DNA-binding MarR family transcriptional regulator